MYGMYGDTSHMRCNKLSLVAGTCLDAVSVDLIVFIQICMYVCMYVALRSKGVALD